MGHVIADIIFVLAGLLIVVLSAKRGFFGTLMRFAKTFLALTISRTLTTPSSLMSPIVGTTLSKSKLN